jgi:hypothetical protein
MSSLLKLEINVSTGIAKTVTQPEAIYLDLNLLFEMIS